MDSLFQLLAGLAIAMMSQVRRGRCSAALKKHNAHFQMEMFFATCPRGPELVPAQPGIQSGAGLKPAPTTGMTRELLPELERHYTSS
jgi:hypothetical protein